MSALTSLCSGQALPRSFIKVLLQLDSPDDPEAFPNIQHASHNCVESTTLPSDGCTCHAGVLYDLPTSCSEDEEILARDIISGALSEQEVLAVRWRRLYKQSLLNCIALAQAVMYDCQYAAEQGQCLS